jgi:hypothetical protein
MQATSDDGWQHNGGDVSQQEMSNETWRETSQDQWSRESPGGPIRQRVKDTVTTLETPEQSPVVAHSMPPSMLLLDSAERDSVI